MDWSQIIPIILGSSVLTVFLDWVFKNFQEDRLHRKEAKKQLYAEMELLAVLVLRYRTVRIDAFDNIKQYGKELQSNNKDYVQDQINKGMSEVNDKLRPQVWFLIDKMKALIESKAGYIQENDVPLVAEFFEAYLKREIVGKDDLSKSIWFNYEKYEEYLDSLFKVVEKLSKINK